jgi:flagellar protein FlaG
MENKFALSVQPTPDMAATQKPVAPAPAPVIEPPPSVDPDLRLVIEEQGETFVYKTVDRRTGEVVQQLPREEVVRMREAEAYAVGDVISTQA